MYWTQSGPKRPQAQIGVVLPRFNIEKLEERIAPRCPPGCGHSGGEHGGGGGCHYNANGKLVGPC